MKKIYVRGYSAINLGDDLFFKLLFDRYSCSFRLISNRYYKKVYDTGKYPNVKIINNNSIYNKFSRFLKRNSVNFLTPVGLEHAFMDIEIGGSMFIEKPDWNHALLSRYENIQLKEHKFIIGSNFGPFYSDDYYREYSKLFSNYDNISFRDSYSYDLFSDNMDVSCAPDAVFSLNITNIKKNKSNDVIISIINPNKRTELSEFANEYKEVILNAVHFYQNLGFNPILMSFCKAEGDEDFINEILNEYFNIYSRKAESYYYDGNIDAALEKLYNSSLVIGTRFHATILALKMGIPVIPIIYSEKTTNTLLDINFPYDYVNFSNLKKLNSDLLLNAINQTPLDISIVEKKSEKHFQILDTLLPRKKVFNT